MSSADGAFLDRFGKWGTSDRLFEYPTALALLPDGTLVLREFCGTRGRVTVLSSFALRMGWITAAVMSEHRYL